MLFDVSLTIRLPADARNLEGVAQALSEAHIPGEVVTQDGDTLVARFPHVQSSGGAALPEALRLAQASTSAALRAAMPGFAVVGGLLWRDITEARVTAVASDSS